jgi:release factor glutamine methyltransferase
MRRVVKYIVGKTYKPLLEKYLAKTRIYHYGYIILEIPPEVFHPRFFFSTKLLLSYLSGMELEGKSFLELGAGSGLISVYATKQRANVTATDINPIAVKTLVKNRLLNKVSFEIIQSDLFDEVGNRQFDIIAINPPYYRKKPSSPADYAWYCGEEGEYFDRLFQSLKDHVNSNSFVAMVLCDGCDLEMIRSLAKRNKVVMRPVYRKKNLLEENVIYQLLMEHES